ncbi:hypothetical protein [Paraburkholderia kururiensis]|uniref:hypothetical protein n=1 Tax=Paraburkholderia kururiensis TaxID=984307 RepID=UPI0039A55853
MIINLNESQFRAPDLVCAVLDGAHTLDFTLATSADEREYGSLTRDVFERVR